MATWSKENVLRFIEEYRSHECLWKVKSKEYCNRIKREHTYESMVAFVKSFEADADKDLVVKKFNNLRNSFRKQLKRLDALKLSGSGADEVEPKLWYFNALEFLRDQEVPRPSLSNIELDIAEEATSTPLDVATDYSPSPCSPGDLPTPTSGNRSSTSQPTPTAAQGAGSSSNNSRPAKRKAATIENDLLALAKHRLLNNNNAREEDEFDTFSRTIGHKLRSMPRDQRVHAQKMISDIMYEAELGALSRNTAIIHRMIPEQPQQPTITDVYRTYDAFQFE